MMIAAYLVPKLLDPLLKNRAFSKITDVVDAQTRIDVLASHMNVLLRVSAVGCFVGIAGAAIVVWAFIVWVGQKPQKIDSSKR